MRRLLALTVAVLAALPAIAQAAPKDANLWLVLEDAVTKGGDNRTDLDVEIQIRDGKVQDWLRGIAFRQSQGRNVGTVKESTFAGGKGKIVADVRIKPDFWVLNGGRATYEIELEPAPNGNGVVGTYTGTYVVTKEPKPVAPARHFKSEEPKEEVPAAIRKWLEKQNKGKKKEDDDGGSGGVEEIETVKVSGSVTGEYCPAWPVKIDGFKPVQPGEHPRLIFRKAELEELKRRAEETPEGKAIMEQFWKVIDNRAKGAESKVGTWPGVGYGFAYQMTGDKKWADKARELMEKYWHVRGGQDIHDGPRLMGMALTFDLACDGWDDEFRKKMVKELWHRTWECATGTNNQRTMGGLNLAWWSNHNGIRAAAAGLGAMAIVGEETPDGKIDDDEMRDIAEEMAWDVKGYVRDGLGGGYWGMEGVFYKGMTMKRGLLSFINAYPKAMGLDVVPAGIGDWMIAGYVIEAPPGQTLAQGGQSIDGEPLRHQLWTTGLGAVPDRLMPAYKYLLDREVGLKGDKTFGLYMGLYAPYALANYPFDVEAKHPNEVLPMVSPDPHNGHWVFRPTWTGDDDVVMSLNLQSHVRPSCHCERTGTMDGWSLVGVGQRWLKGQYHPQVDGKAEAVALKNGPTTIGWDAGDDIATLVLDTSHAYMPQVQGKGNEKLLDALAQKAGGLKAVHLRWWGNPLVDHGIRGTRHLAVDGTGKSGVPMMVAVAEVLGVKPALDADPEPAAFTWRLPLETKGGKLNTEGNTFTLTKGDAYLAGVVCGAESLDKDAVAKVAGGELLAVFVVGKGEPPEFKVAGDGPRTKVTVGGRTVRFDGKKVVLGE